MVEVSESPAIGVLDLSPQAPSKLLRIQVNESLIIKSRIRLDRVEVPDPTVVDVSVTSPQELTIIGKAIGYTQFTIMGEGQIQNCTVMVGPNYKPLQNLIQAVSPQSSVRVDGLNGTIVLSAGPPTPTQLARSRRWRRSSREARCSITSGYPAFSRPCSASPWRK